MRALTIFRSGGYGKERKGVLNLLAALFICFLFPATGFANPQGGTVVSGTASFATSGNTLDVDQTSQQAVINWNSFNIAPNETTNINTPGASSISVDRVTGGDPAQIYGTLKSNGQIILLDPNGVFFEKGSTVDTNGIIASTGQINTAAFMSGQNTLAITGMTSGTVQNQGLISVKDGGLAALVAPQVLNSGVIQANLGQVTLASGSAVTVDLYGDKLVSLAVTAPVAGALVSNSGNITAQGGSVLLTARAAQGIVNDVINMSGVINAQSFHQHNGKIVLDGGSATTGGKVTVSGTLNASGHGTGQTGGAINITGNTIELQNTAVVDASGTAGGGTINIGGDLHGQGALADAATTTIDSGAQVKADALSTGNGGQIVVWSNDETTVNGAIEAEGGMQSGNGGFVETSSHGLLNVSTPVDASAPHGTAGEWLLDPANVNIFDPTAPGLTIRTDTNINNCPACVPDGTVATSQLTTTTIDAALNAGTNVSVTTGGDSNSTGSGDISVTGAISTTGNGSLTLSAYRSVVTGDITLQGGNVTIRADNTGQGVGEVIVEGITTTNGDITIGGGAGAITAGNGFAYGDPGYGTSAPGVFVEYGITSVNGNIIINGHGNKSGSIYSDGVDDYSSVYTTGTGTISINGIGSGNGYGVNVGGETGVGNVITNNANISITGVANNVGIVVGGFGIGVAAGGTGTISLNGSGEYGVYVTNSKVSSANGNISIVGMGAGYGTMDAIDIDKTSSVQVTGSGTLTLNGTGAVEIRGVVENAGQGSISIQGIGTETDPGVWVYGGTVETLGAGSLSVTGAGASISSGSDSGVVVAGGSIVANGGSLSVTGTGGSGPGSGNYGIEVTGSGSAISNIGAGTITLNGVGGGMSASGGNYGVYTTGGGTIETTGAGALSVTGTGGNTTGAGNIGVILAGGSITANGGALSVTGTGGGGPGMGNYGIDVTGLGAVISNTGGGTITLNGVTSDSDGVSITAGGAVAAVNGNILVAGSGGNDGLAMDASSSSISSSGGGNITVVVNADSFGAASNLFIASGRWLVYSISPAYNSDSVLTTSFVRYSCTYGGTCPAFPAMGNGLLYHYTPLLTATPNVLYIGPGMAGPSLAGYAYALSGYRGSDAGADTVTGSLNGTTNYTAGAGTYGINYASGALTSALGYGFVYANNAAGIVVTPYVVAVTANAQSKVYGSADPVLTYIYSPTQNGDPPVVFTGGLTRVAGENVGTYAINQGTLSAGPNYAISYTGNNLTITPYALTVIANVQSKVYGSTDPALTYTYNALQNGDTAAIFTGGLVRLAGENVGAYAINQGTLSAGANYTISYTSNNLTITPYTLTVTANIQSKVYGAADPALTYTYGTLQDGDTASVFTGNLTRIAGENVGAYAINQGILSAGPNYTISYIGNNLTIAPAVLTITANAQSKVYGSNSALTYTYGTLQNGDTATIFTGALSTTGQNVGTYAINQGSLSAGGNYTISYTGNSLTITPAALKITANNETMIYGGAMPALTASYTGLVNGDTAASLTKQPTLVSGTVATANAGIYNNTITVSGAADANYTISYAPGTLTINPYTLDITANTVSKVYGTIADPALTYAITGGTSLQDGNKASIITGALTRVAGQNAGAYAINQGTLSAGPNYTISYAGNNLTITPYQLTVSAKVESKVYGAVDPALTYTYSKLQNGDTAVAFTGGLNRVAGENTGTYAINQGTLSVGANYTISYIGNSLTITPFKLAVTAIVQSKVYGSADPALSYTYGTLQNGDTASVFAGALARLAGENVGTYAIKQGTLSAGTNYTISYTGNNLTITPYLLTVTANAQTKVYGSTDPALTYTYGALQNGDTASVFSGSLYRTPGQVVGSYAINEHTLSAGRNYAIVYIGNNLTITPYNLTISANAISKVYGAADPALTFTHGTLQDGDGAGIFTGSMTRVAGQNVGTYTISQGTLSAGPNYTITFTGNSLTITPYALSVKANAQSIAYGATDPALTYTYGKLQNGDTASVITGGLTRTAGENAGTYTISQGTLSAGSNYTISYTGNNLVITPYKLAVTANAQSEVYGSADPSLAYTYGTLQNGDTASVFTGALARVAGENVGTYAIKQGTLSAGTNYTISYAGNNLTITPYLLTVTANAQTKVYGSADPALTYTYGALQNGDTASVFSGSLYRTPGQVVGSYTINEHTLSAGRNYTIVYIGNNLTITPYNLTISANAISKVYSAADPALTFTHGTLQDGDGAGIFTGSMTRVAGQNVGTYTISQGTLSAGPNYTITFTGNNLTITPYALTVTATAQSKVYGAVDPALTYTYGKLQNGDTSAVFTGGLTRVAGENVGAYAITQGTLSAGTNYTISYTSHNLTITPYLLTVVAEAETKVYGAADPALDYTYGTLQNGDTSAVFTGELTRVAGQNVGTYAIKQGTLSAGTNYTLSYTGNNLTITP